VRLLTIDDVPFLTLTLHGGDLPAGDLRKLGDEVARELSAVPDMAQVRVLGGARRQVRIEPDPARLRSYGSRSRSSSRLSRRRRRSSRRRARG